ncbi:GNAT family N-acetyltransferase [Flavobacteriaceae bacterium S356]|uniref:GNAT family N-acetyltransferase n=1 Tax=Asprobacillus argus TaxID=3076534 RepID=A0ABU3LJA3_9FLAO|nr:GNAT family N-acetyltransferase [Flavobacteriaceae bacterium S356]
MKEEEIPDYNIFMMCESLDKNALSELSKEFKIRSCREDELPIWRAFPFDNPKDAMEYDQFMVEYFNSTYKGKETEFYNKTLFVCDKNDNPLATCMVWKAYGVFNAIHWFKVLKKAEGNGIGRALFSIIMKSLKDEDYPIYLHTQPSSFRAIKLYSDFGFDILTDEKIGTRQNEIDESLPILKEFMPDDFFQQLRFRKAPKPFVETVKRYKTNEF